MKHLFILFLLFTCTKAGAQVLTLEHSYATNYSIGVVKLENEGQKYEGIDTGTKQLKLYNTDHSLWKTISFAIPAGATLYGSPHCISENFFNSDAKIEFLIGWSKLTNNVYYNQLDLYNEDGTKLDSVTDAYYGAPTKVGNDWKLIVYRIFHQNNTISYHDDVYAVPGQYLGLKTAPVSENAVEATATLFPNPVLTAATIRYQLPAGNNEGTLQVYDIAGKPVRTYTVTNSFGDLQIERGTLPPGVYTYKITGAAGASKAEQFVIQ